jgi:NADH-ubiquinone oxidoreductase chain 5
LVHSSTLVTAGVYVLIRFNYIFCGYFFGFFKVFFLFTIILAGLCALVETDLKKVVAISTLSQLGIIIFILSRGAWVLSFLHIIIHAFFKSILFLRTGSLMGQMGGLQDSRFYGSSSFSFGSFIFFLVSCFCLGGFPFFLGFYSKDFIISSFSFMEGSFFYIVFLFGCFLTVSYRFRLVLRAYFYFYKYESYFFFFERFEFFLFVFFLFFKC